MAALSRTPTPAEVAAMVDKGWSWYSGDGDEYPHFWKDCVTQDGTGRRVLVREACWRWGEDRWGFPRSMTISDEEFSDHVTCLVAAELSGWEL